jgi:hypothetical protein
VINLSNCHKKGGLSVPVQHPGNLSHTQIAPEFGLSRSSNNMPRVSGPILAPAGAGGGTGHGRGGKGHSTAAGRGR